MAMKFFYYSVHPLRLMIFYSTPDVRAKGLENRSVLAVLACIIWMAIVSYVIIKGLDIIGTLIHVDGAVMGITAGAWAASYPALWSSLTVARDSYGDIASCNAFGSNVFNNFIGLGLPWLTYSVVNQNAPYSNIPNSGIALAFITLNAVMVAFYIMVAWNGYRLQNW
jgi:sodium/potassium/calcium exchanger 4